MKRTIIGLDLQKNYSQISYYNEKSGEVDSVSISTEHEQYLIPTPKDLFITTKEAMDLGTMSLGNFIKSCISYIHPVPEAQDIYLMITMQRMEAPWIDYLKDACEMIGILREHVFLQTYRESFCCYVMNQRKDFWTHSAALFDYSDDQITSFIMRVDTKTKPAFVTVEQIAKQDMGNRGKLNDKEWDEVRDRSFLNLAKETFSDEMISSVFLIGDDFDKSWTAESLPYLCKRRHVFQGVNMYTKGACYGLCQKLHIGKNSPRYLYKSEDLVRMNLCMYLEIRGNLNNYLLINAGGNWYDAEHSCEIILDSDKELIFSAKSMMGGEVMNYSIPLIELKDRPPRTTRLLVHVKFISAGTCTVRVKDLGFGEFFPATGLSWESTLNLE